MKCLSLLILVVFLQYQANGQLKGFSIGPYAEYASPVGSFSDTHKRGIGAGISGDIRLGRLGLTGSAGILHFGGRSISNAEAKDNSSITAWPVRLGLKYRLLPALYAKFEAGNASMNNNGGNAFILSPGVGIRLLNFDFQIKYESWKGDITRNFLGARLGIGF